MFLLGVRLNNRLQSEHLAASKTGAYILRQQFDVTPKTRWGEGRIHFEFEVIPRSSLDLAECRRQLRQITMGHHMQSLVSMHGYNTHFKIYAMSLGTKTCMPD